MSNKQPEATKQPEEVKPVSDEALDRMKRTLPTSMGGVIELEDKQRGLYDVLGPVIGIGNKDYLRSKWGAGDIYSVIERTHLEPEEFSVFSRLAARAEHGLGGIALDRPMIKVGERLVMELRARRSRMGESSAEFENIMTTWIRELRAKEEQKLQEQQGRLVGAG